MKRENSSVARAAGPLLKHLVTILLAAAAVAFGVHHWETLGPTLASVDPFWLVLGALFHLANYGFRTLRFKMLTGGRLKAWPTGFAAVITHGALTYLMPMRTGDLTLPAILRRACGFDWGEGLRVLLWARVLDICALGLCILGAAVFLPVGMPEGFRVIWIGVGVLLAAFPAICLALSRLDTLRPRWLFAHARHLAEAGRISRSRLAVSIGIWAMVGGLFYCAGRAVGLPLEAGDAWFLVTVQLPLQLIPLQGAGNAGNHEAGWVAALTILGYTADEAMSFALATHALILAYVFGMLFLGMALTALVSACGKGPSSREGA